MPNQVQLVRQEVASVMVRGLIASLLSSFAAALYAQTVDPESVLGDTTIPSPEDLSQNFPYGITGKTPPSLIKINYEGQKPYHKHRINLRLFQGCPQVEISEGGRLWATWFGSNVQAERAPYHKGQFSVISTSSDGGKTWKEVFVFDPSELLGGGASDPMQFSINTKCILKTLPSGRVLLVANDVQMKEEGGKTIYYYTDESGIDRELEKHKTARTCMTAYLSDDDGKTFSHRMLLWDEGQISYPSTTLSKDGTIYIVYDQGRGVIGQHTIFLSKITEEDILAGKLVKDESSLNHIVSRPSDQGGGRRQGDNI